MHLTGQAEPVSRVWRRRRYTCPPASARSRFRASCSEGIETMVVVGALVHGRPGRPWRMGPGGAPRLLVKSHQDNSAPPAATTDLAVVRRQQRWMVLGPGP